MASDLLQSWRVRSTPASTAKSAGCDHCLTFCACKHFEVRTANAPAGTQIPKFARDSPELSNCLQLFKGVCRVSTHVASSTSLTHRHTWCARRILHSHCDLPGLHLLPLGPNSSVLDRDSPTAAMTGVQEPQHGGQFPMRSVTTAADTAHSSHRARPARAGQKLAHICAEAGRRCHAEVCVP